MKTAVIVNDHAVVNGGQAKVAVETALALRGGGLEVIFFSGVGPADPRLEKAGVRCICLNQFDMVADPVRCPIRCARHLEPTGGARAGVIVADFGS